MNVREVLWKLAENQDQQDRIGATYSSSTRFVDIDYLAPVIEKALRAAYDCGFRDRCVDDPCDNHNGVTAGIAAMVKQ